MIALDTSSVAHYLAGSTGSDVEAVEVALATSQGCLPPVVLAELLSTPERPRILETTLLQIPLLEITPGYWERAGRLRARVIGRGRKAKLADALIAQTCIDHDVPLVTRDDDFQQFVEAGLRLAL